MACLTRPCGDRGGIDGVVQLAETIVDVTRQQVPNSRGAAEDTCIHRARTCEKKFLECLFNCNFVVVDLELLRFSGSLIGDVSVSWLSRFNCISRYRVRLHVAIDVLELVVGEGVPIIFKK